ncbi:hypothetical protein ACJW30_10G074600 [Castanea mollissima]
MMKVHDPAPKKRNMKTAQYGVASKKLRRLPHVFARVLELPIRSTVDVSVQETSDSLRFIVTTTNNNKDTSNMSQVRAHTIKILPGMTKVVIKGMGGGDDEFDVWRFRLPPSTRPKMTSARFSGGELVVTVPKGVDTANDSYSDDDDDDNNNGEIKVKVEGWVGGSGRLIFIQ